jgi:hypothetical protein
METVLLVTQVLRLLSWDSPACAFDNERMEDACLKIDQ